MAYRPASIVSLLAPLGLALATASLLGAQTGSPPTLGAVYGAVRDGTSGVPVIKASVCAHRDGGPAGTFWRCAAVDSAGTYRLDRLPTGVLRLSVHCEVIAGSTRPLASEYALVGAVPVHRTWGVASAGCDGRRVRRVAGVFRGHFTSGFEVSAFVPCAADGWFLPGDSLGTSDSPSGGRHAWASMSAAVQRGVRWPRRVPRTTSGSVRYFVHWRGTVVGPGGYGHLGGSPFAIHVDSVLEVRAPGRRDCQ